MFDVQHREVQNGSIEDVHIAYIGGGSEAWAHVLINDLAQCADVAGRVTLYDINTWAAELNADLGNHVMERDEAVGEWSFTATEDLETALTNADFVICSVQDPPEDTFRYDLELPAKYGIYQPVGDTVGPGGVVRSLRAIPQYRDIAAAVERICPEAWVINYTNPMAICTRALYATFPGIKAIGLCHEVFKGQRLFAGLAEEYVSEATAVTQDDIAIDITGINHFTWITSARWRGHDLYPLLENERSERTPLPRFEPGSRTDAGLYTDEMDVTFDLFDRYGVLPVAGDRHLAEFVPWYLDVDDPDEIHRWGIRLTPPSYRVERSYTTRETHRSEDILAGDRSFELGSSGEEVVAIMRSLLGLEPLVTHVNLPNRGQVPDLARETVVETNAIISGDTVTPHLADPLPPAIRGLLQPHVRNQETLIESGMTGDLDLGFRAFRNDPLVSIQPDQAACLFRELVETQQAYFESYDLENATVLER